MIFYYWALLGPFFWFYRKVGVGRNVEIGGGVVIDLWYFGLFLKADARGAARVKWLVLSLCIGAVFCCIAWAVSCVCVYGIWWFCGFFFMVWQDVSVRSFCAFWVLLWLAAVLTYFYVVFNGF